MIENRVAKEKTGSMFNGFLGGTISLTVSAIIVKFLGLVYKIPLASLLGDEGMGYFNSAYTVYTFFYLLCTAGVPKAIMILVSEAKAEENYATEKRILRLAAIIFLSIGLVVSLLFIVFSNYLASLIGNNKSALTMIAIAPSVIFIALGGVLRGYLSANLRLIDVALSQIVEGVSKLVLGLIFAMFSHRLGLSLEVVSAMTILGVTFGSLFGLIYLLFCSKNKKQKENAGQTTFSDKWLVVAKRIFRISIPITLSAAVMSITNVIDLSLIMRNLESIGYTEAEASALYGNYTTLAVPMFNLAISLISPISIAFLPVFTRALVREDYDTLISEQRNALTLTYLLSAPIMIGLIVYSKEILRMLFGNSGVDVGAPLLCILAPSILFSSILVILNTILEAGGKVRAPVYSMLAGSLAKVIVSYILLRKENIGIAGAPIGTLVCYCVALTVSLIIYNNMLKLNFPCFSTLFKPHFIAFLSVLISRIVYDLLIKLLSENISLIMSIILCALVYLAFSYLSGTIKKDTIYKLSKYTKFS